MDLLQRSIFLKNGTKFWNFFHHLFQTGLVNHCAKNQPICIFCLGATALGSWKIKIFQFSLIFQNFAILRHPNGQNMFSSDGSQYFHARSPPRIFFNFFSPSTSIVFGHYWMRSHNLYLMCIVKMLKIVKYLCINNYLQSSKSSLEPLFLLKEDSFSKNRPL